MKKFFLLAPLVGCSNGNDKTDGGGSEGGSDVVAGGTKLTGTVTAYESMAVLSMATVTAVGGASAVTGDNGKYTLSVMKGTPMYIALTGDQYIKLIEQEFTLMGDANKDEVLVRTSTQASLKAFLPGYDITKAALIVGVTKRSSCASSEGAIVDLDPPQAGSARAYTQGGLPSANRTFAADGQRIFFYNIDPKAKVGIKLSWAMPDDAGGTQPAAPCKMVPYPVQDTDQPNLTYTGNVTLEAGDAISYERLFLQ